MTEVNVLKLELPPAALEAAIVSYANGGQLKRAEDLYRKLDSPSAAVTTALVECLAGSHEGASRAAVLLDEMASAGGQQQGHLSSAYNLVARALARQGSIDESYGLITRMMRSEVLQVEGRTFTSVATCCMNVERTELAEELLEMRDYL